MAKSRSPYFIRRVDSDDEADAIRALLNATGLPSPKANYEVQWWFAFFDEHPIAYLGMMQSLVVENAGYLIRVGVLPAHRGNALQLRLMRCAEQWAKSQGFGGIISDTRFNPPSANNFIRAGYQTFAPPAPWAFPESIYWRKDLAA
jgi:GNAT superfamily N-acetyltransferase